MVLKEMTISRKKMGVAQTLTLFICLLVMLGLSTAQKKHDERRKLAGFLDRAGSISIDCGANEDYVDQQSGIFYKSDAGFIATGVNNVVSPKYSLASFSIPYLLQMLQTLRSFPKGTKNCYNLELEKGNAYMVRVISYYGNYDLQDNPPEFDVYLGVNYWLTMSLPDQTSFYHSEIIQFFDEETAYICLVNTGSGIPIISGLEFRLLNNSIYHSESKSIQPQARYSLSTPYEGYSYNMRYKDDVYDRVWSLVLPAPSRGDGIINTTAEVVTPSSPNRYRIPEEVLRTAAQPLNHSRSLKFSYTLLDPDLRDYSSKNLYVYFHFCEIVNTTGDRRREFSITLNGVKLPPITLEYLKPQSIGPQPFPMHRYFNFSIDATPESDLPPILNAFEVYLELDFSTSPTNPVDANAMMDIKQIYRIDKDDWQGDPCVPITGAWTGLVCSSEDPPRIVSMNLSSSNLRGEIYPALSNLTAIESLDLSNNELTGSVPEFLAQLPNLKFLNLTGNKFVGPIPVDLRTKSSNGALQLSVSENQCQTGQCNNRNKKIVALIVGSAVLVLALIILLGVINIMGIRRARRNRKENSMEGLAIELSSE